MTGDESAKVGIEFPALWQMTDREKAEYRRIKAETDRIYSQEGVLLPEEVAIQRFSTGEYAVDITSRAELAQKKAPLRHGCFFINCYPASSRTRRRDC